MVHLDDMRLALEKITVPIVQSINYYTRGQTRQSSEKHDTLSVFLRSIGGEH